MLDYKFDNIFINFIKLIIISSILIPGMRSDDNSDFCWNPECTKLGEEVLGNINPSINPCEDFYEYACGNWTTRHPLPTPDSNVSVLELMLKELYSKLRDLLSRKIIPADKPLVKKSKQLLQACTNLTRINRNGIKNMRKILDDIGGWPIMYPPDMFDDSRPWEEVHYYFARMTGDGAFFNIDVSQDYRHKMFDAIYLDQPSGMFGLFPRLNDPGSILKYADFIKKIVTLFVQDAGSKATPQNIDQDIRDVFRLRYLLQVTLNFGTVRPHPTYADFTIDGLQQATPTPKTPDEVPIDWLKIFKGTFDIIEKAKIEKDTEIILREPTYILGLVHRILNTPLRTLVNHIHLYFVERHLKYMPENIMDLVHDITEKVVGRRVKKVERWQKCIQDHPMQHVLSSIYIHWYFPQATRAKVSHLTTDIKKTMKERIKRASWMNSSTKREALLKIDNMKNVIGSDEWYRHYEGKLEEYYKGQKVGWKYLENVLNFEQNEYKIELGYLTGESMRVSNDDFPITPNAYYEITNTLVLNVGQIQPPFYHSNYPPVVNYPGLGTVIAHEMAHGFDKTGNRYDHEGKRVNWWSNSSLAEYESRSRCLIDQFNNYDFKELAKTHPNWRVNGVKTLRENFSDLLGIMVSYEAYKTRMKGFVQPSRVANLYNIDNEKVFFLVYANTFCEHMNEWTLEHRAMVDTHTTSRLRVNGPLSNMPEFSQAFNCAPGTPLNRPTKCMIW